MKYDIEISGSKTVKRMANDIGELKKIAERARGTISVCQGDMEVFIGSPLQLLDRIEVAEDNGYNYI